MGDNLQTQVEKLVKYGNDKFGLNETTLRGVLDNANAGSAGIIPTGTLEITQNGTYDVTEYASADVQIEDFYEGTLKYDVYGLRLNVETTTAFLPSGGNSNTVGTSFASNFFGPNFRITALVLSDGTEVSGAGALVTALSAMPTDKAYITAMKINADASMNSTAINTLYFAKLFRLPAMLKDGTMITSITTLTNLIKNPTSDLIEFDNTYENINVKKIQFNMNDFSTFACYLNPKIIEIIINEGVTNIGDTFRFCQRLTKVTVPTTLERFTGGFQNCNNLKTLVCLGTTPPIIASTNGPFKNVRNLKVYVPYGCTEAYESATNWGYFLSSYGWTIAELNEDGTIPEEVA